MKYRIETTWRNASGEMHNGSDERVLSEHETYDEAILALKSCEPAHPHNFAQVIDDAGRIIAERYL